VKSMRVVSRIKFVCGYGAGRCSLTDAECGGSACPEVPEHCPHADMTDVFYAMQFENFA
jgi:hypothetical protein